MTAARAMPYLAAGAAGAGIGLALSAQAPVLRAAPALAAVLGGATAVANAGGGWALALLVVAPFFPISFGLPGAVVGPPDVAVALVLVFWAARWITAGRDRMTATAGDWPLVALMLAAVAATVAGALSASEVPPGASLKKTAQLAFFVATYYFAATAARDRKALRFAVAVFLGFSAIEAAYAVLFQFVPGQLGLPGLWPPYLANRASARAMGTVDASFGHYMAAALVVAIAVASQGQGRLRALAAMAVPVVFAGLVASGTRGSLVAAAAGVALLVAFSPHRRTVAAYLGGLVALAGIAVLAAPAVASPAKLEFLFTSHGASNLAVRLLSWKIGWDLAIAHPWLGMGPGANALTIEGLIGVPAEALRYVEGTMNAYLQAFLEMGVGGLAGLAAFIALVSGAALSRGARGKRPSARQRGARPAAGRAPAGGRPPGGGTALGLGAAVFVLGVTGLTGPLLMGGIGHLLFALAGLAAAAAARPQEAEA